jgi:hypothetical protein
LIIDFKYHVASLVAVFLALGIGILIGISLISNDALVKKQASLVTSLQKQYDALHSENLQKSNAINNLETLAVYQGNLNKAVLPVLVHNKLVGHRVVVIDLLYSKNHDAMINLLRTAGADVQSVSMINLGMIKEPVLSKQVAVALGKPADADPGQYLPDFAKLLAGVTMTGTKEDLIQLLTSKGAMKISGSYGPPLTDAIIIGGAANKNQDFAGSFDLTLADAWQKAGLKVYGVEDSDVSVSYMRYYQGASMTTVDDLDAAYGQLALVEAMAGYPGHYGTKQSADTFIPPLQ